MKSRLAASLALGRQASRAPDAVFKDGKYYFMWSEGGWTGPNYAVAYAIGLLVVALRPAKARGMLPLAAALAGCASSPGVDVAPDGTLTVTRRGAELGAIGVGTCTLFDTAQVLWCTPTAFETPARHNAAAILTDRVMQHHSK